MFIALSSTCIQNVSYRYAPFDCLFITFFKDVTAWSGIRDGPLEKWWGGVGKKKQKKIHARENAKKKNSCKEEGKEKKFMQKEGPIVTFSESLSFRNQQYYQAQYE